MYDRNKVISLAEAELGYHEKATNAHLDDKTANSGSGNFTKYGRDLDSLGDFYNGPKNGFAWCDQFYDWLMYKCFGKEAALKLLCQPAYSAGAGCYYSALYYKQRGQFHASGPQPGDQVFFAYSAGEVSHTGIVVSVSGSTVITIEGNTSDGVYRRSYSVSSSQIYGYGRPDWGLANEATAASAANDEITRVAAEIIDGKWGNGAERVARLIAAGYDCVAVQNRVNELLQKEEAAPSTSAADVSESDTPAAVYTLELAELSKGIKGAAVRRVQVLLIDRAYKCGGKIRGGREEPDGEFGPMTVAAIEAFQREIGITVTGIVDRATMKALLN